MPSKNRRVLLPGRALVHFAVSNDEVYMTTALKGSDTRFLPFNQGHDGAGGNPPIAGKSATSYLWEKVLRPRLLLRILSDFAVWEPDSKSKRGTQGKLISRASTSYARWRKSPPMSLSAVLAGATLLSTLLAPARPRRLRGLRTALLGR